MKQENDSSIKKLKCHIAVEVCPHLGHYWVAEFTGGTHILFIFHTQGAL